MHLIDCKDGRTHPCGVVRAPPCLDGAISSKVELCLGRRRLRSADPRWRNVRRGGWRFVERCEGARERLFIRAAECERAGCQRPAALGGRRIGPGRMLCRRAVSTMRGMHGVLVVQRLHHCVRIVRHRRGHRSVVFMTLAGDRSPRHIQMQHRDGQQNGGDAFQGHVRILAAACGGGSGR